MKKKVCQLFAIIVSLPILVSGMVSCQTTPESGPSPSGTAGGGDHKPSYDYWQNGGGACCPAHSHLFEGY